MSGKLYIKTFGCQMNEYDSSRMADALREAEGLLLTDRPEEADVLLLNTCSIREKAQEKVFSQLGRWRPWKERNPRLIIGVGGCVASQEGDAIRERAPYVDLVFGPQTLHRLPQMIRESPPRAPAGGGCLLPRDREIRPPAGAPRRGPQRLCLDHGGLFQILHLLRGALHPRRGDQPPVRRCDRRGGGAGGPGGARGQPAGAERERLPGRDARRRKPPIWRC